jgi:hypothetical protein
MTQMVVASITTSLDGYIAGPNDGPERGLGEGGERLHYWVFGGAWSYNKEATGEPTGVDKEFLDEALGREGAVIGGRNTYEAADHWGGEKSMGPSLLHPPASASGPARGRCLHVRGWAGRGGCPSARGSGREGCLHHGRRRRHPTGAPCRSRRRTVHLDPPVVLGARKRLFDGFDETVELDHVGVQQSPFATQITYRVVR